MYSPNMRMFIFLGLVVLSMGSRLCPDHVKEQDIIDTCLPLDPVIYSAITDKNSFCLAAVRMWGCIHDNWSGCFHFQDGDFVSFIQIIQQVCIEHFDAYHTNVTTTDGRRCVGQGAAVNYQELSAKCPIMHPSLRAITNHTDICKNFRRVLNCAKKRFPSCPEIIQNAFTFYACEGFQDVVEEIRQEEVELKIKLDKLVEEVSRTISALGEYGGASHGRLVHPQKVFDIAIALKEIKAGLDELIQVFSVKIPRLDVVGGYGDDTLHSGNANQSTCDNAESPRDNAESPRTEVRTHPRRRTVQTRSNASSEQASDSIKLSINLSIPLP